MAKSETQRSITTHGNAADRPIISPLVHTVFRFDQRDELLQKKVAIADGAIGGVDIETAPAFGSGDQKIAKLMLLAEFVEQCPTRSEERRVGKECRSRWSPYH